MPGTSCLLGSRAQHSGALRSVNVAERDAQIYTHVDTLVHTATTITATAVAAVAGAVTAPAQEHREHGEREQQEHEQQLERVCCMVNMGRRLCLGS